MSLKSEHEKKFNHDSEFQNSISYNKFPDWTVVTFFYRAVHLIEAVFSITGQHSNSHNDRKAIMEDDTVLYPIDLTNNYKELESLSRQARYKPELPMADDEVKIAQDCFDVVKSWYDSKTINPHI